MSAIFGIVRFDRGDADLRALDRMRQAMATRLPDGSEHIADGPAALGRGLMRVTREDRFDQQPVFDRTAGRLLVADLRIDNREELAAALDIAEPALVEMADSALLMRAFAAWGEACVDHVIGDFAFAIWDARTRRLTLARDPMGQRQLYYHLDADRITFATEVPALWAEGAPHALREGWAERRAYRELRSAPGETPFAGISGLSGGTVITVDRDGVVTSRRYWQPHADPAHLGKDIDYYIAAYRRVLEEAVACRVRRLDRPPGLVLSGGFDSGAIAGLAGPSLTTSGLRLVAASSVASAGAAAKGDARRWVELCARDMPHLDVGYVTGDGRDLLSGLEQAFENAVIGASAEYPITTALFESLATRGARLVMDGHGGDYTLNPRGDHMLAELAAQGRFRDVVREAVAHRRVTGDSWWRTVWNQLLRPSLPAPVRHGWERLKRGGRPPRPLALLRRERVDTLVAEGRLRKGGTPIVDPRDFSLRIVARLADQSDTPHGTLAASYGLEMTRPFHDRRVVELALAAPVIFQVREGRNRHLARRALADIYPREFLTRGRRNDRIAPDQMRMVRRDLPELLREAERLAATGAGRVFDLEGSRAIIAKLDTIPKGRRAITEQEQNAGTALRTLFAARYLEWFRRSNDPRNDD
ncbi:asparagine synthase-related protein [Sphingomonas immobilis]|uniref:asparagine synthase (glutamine-hydrolyzing) n=1 Tax=Sphingomonas immobilis TaxID=3063997 RepID=A0ABT8ZZY4_9SPHN|nr:asparagine synthase-related protein [Sphingomonas sp. CA1-15]MDO7843145.1 asparagine synthase-related protein [Sphingomonas sp. CA1-15]